MLCVLHLFEMPHGVRVAWHVYYVCQTAANISSFDVVESKM
jgi:hypothetical protein